jgi:putative NADPH-quinone reductase
MNIALIHAHPETDSLGEANTQALVKAGKDQGHVVKIFNVFDFPVVDRNPIKHGFPAAFTPAVDYIAKVDYVVCTGPMWNFGYPGMFKNFLDGVTQSPKMFQFVADPFLGNLIKWFNLSTILPEAKPVGLMKAKKVLCVWTADGPAWYYAMFWWKNTLYATVKTVFGYCGVKKFEQKVLGMTRKRSKKAIKKWLNDLENYSFE